MDTRRSFIGKITKSAALSSLALSSFASEWTENKVNRQKLIRVGIIGAENSHTVVYGKMFNTDKKFPGVEVRYARV